MRHTRLHVPTELGPIVLGGAGGASIRWGLIELLPGGEPLWGLLVVNGLGCFLIGWLRGNQPRPRPAHGTLTIGFCGGLTTFSTVSVEAALLLDQGRSGLTAAYLAASLATGIALVIAGRRLRSSEP